MDVLFDLYGTLADIETDEASPAFWEEVARAVGENATRENYLSLCAQAEAELPAGGEIDLLGVFARMTGPKGDAAAFARTFRTLSRRRLRLFPYAAELLRGLKERGVRTYLFSNAQACFTRDELRLLGLGNAFCGVLLSSEAGWKKPSREFFACGFARFGLDARSCVYVGNDLRDDVGGAHGAGMRCVYLQTEQSGRYGRAPTPDWCAADLKEVYNIILSLL